MQNKEGVDKFYVYVHRKKDDNIIFYVGKGQANRYKSISGRNLHWKNTCKKHGWYSVIIQNNLTESDALETGIFYNSIAEAGERLNLGRKTIKLRNRIHICR